MDLSFYWHMLMRRFPLIFVLSLAGAAAGVWIALTLPSIYISRATLIVESGQIPDELAASTVRTGEIEALQIIQQRILSREVLLELANDLGIYDGSEALGADQKVANMRERINIVTEGGQRTRRGPQDATIVRVGFSSNSAQLSADTVNELVTLILQTNLEMRTSVARQTLDFFTQEVDRFEADLSQLSAQILAFQENNLGALPDSLEFRRDQQARLSERLGQLDRDQTALQDRRAQLVTLFEATGTTQLDTAQRQIQSLPRQELRPAEQRLATLRGEYESLVAVLSENNPRMVLLRSQISAAEELVAALPPIQSDNSAQEAAVAQATSVFDIQLADIDAQIAYIDDQRASTEAQLAQLERSIEATPGNAVTLAALERSYAALQEQYNQAIANQSRAETGSIIESLSRGQRITVVEQAVPPEFPSSPNRPLVSISGLAGGLGLALTIVILFELLNRTIRRPEDLERALGVEAFATVPYITTRREAFRNAVRKLTIVTLFCGGVVGALWYVDQNVRPLQPLLERVLEAASLI